MSLLLVESCDLPNIINHAGDKWQMLNSGITNDNVTVDGLKAWQWFLTNSGELRKNFTQPTSKTIVVGCRQRFPWSANNSARPLMYFNAGAVTTNTDGSINLGILGGSTTNPEILPSNVWHYFELKYKRGAGDGEIRVRVNNTEVYAATGLSNDGVLTRVGFGPESGTPMYRRDIYVLSGDGTAYNNFLGPITVEALVPNGNGDINNFTVTGAASNYQAVDETDPNGDTDYVESQTAGHREYYTFPAPTKVTADPIAVAVQAHTKYITAPLQVAASLRRSSTNADGTASTTNAAYTMAHHHIFETDPIAAGAWTLTNLNNTQFGLVTS